MKDDLLKVYKQLDQMRTRASPAALDITSIKAALIQAKLNEAQMKIAELYDLLP